MYASVLCMLLRSHKMYRHFTAMVQVTVLTRETEVLATENNQLHHTIIQETEKQKRQEREHLRRHKSLQDTVAELTFWKASSSERHATLERENAGLRAKTQELLHDLEAYQEEDSDGAVSLEDTLETRTARQAQHRCFRLAHVSSAQQMRVLMSTRRLCTACAVGWTSCNSKPAWLISGQSHVSR